FVPFVTVLVPVQVPASHCARHQSAADLRKCQSMRIQANYVVSAPGRKFAQSEVSRKPIITSLSPEAGPIGTLVTVRGAGFTLENTVQFEGDERPSLRHPRSARRTALPCNSE